MDERRQGAAAGGNFTVKLERRTVYGSDLLYPVGAAADPLGWLTKKKTVDHKDIAALTQLGVTVVIVGAVDQTFEPGAVVEIGGRS